MNRWSQYRLIDIMSNIDLSLVEEEIPEGDLDNMNLFPEVGNRWNRKKIAMISGIAASSIAITGAALLVFRKHNGFRRAA